MRNSIRKQLTTVFIGLAVGPLLLVGAVLAGLSYSNQVEQALNLQQETAQRVATQVTAFFEGLEDELRVVSQVQGLQEQEPDKQQGILSELLSYNDVFETLILLDSEGQELIHLSRLSLASTGMGNRAEADEFVIPRTTGEVYYSPVRFEATTGEPLMTIAMPLLNARTGLAEAVLVADIRIKKIWNLMADVRVEGGQSVYIVDAQNKVVAHRNPSIVLKGTNFTVPNRDGIQPGLTGTNTTLSADASGLDRLVLWLVKRLTGGDAVLAVDTAHFGDQEFNIVAEQIISEALALAVNTVLITVALVVAALVVAGGLGFLTVYSLVRPIQSMARSAEAISAGDLSQQVEITRQDELGVLAKAFNSMTAQLRQTLAGLEERVADRTHRLEMVANISERLTAILYLEELLFEVVNQVKENFDYYHAHIYLVDENQEYLVMTAGTGPAGAKMKEQGHRIRLDAPTSLVARAARNKEIVTIDNVREAPDWLPNELLPDTYSEMAVPIILEGQVVGVLDVQEDKIAGLDEGDAGLLRSLANQVAVAVHNARQFEQVEAALAEAHELQQRYLQQAWDRSQVARRGAGRVQYNLDEVVTLPEATIAEARQQALARQQLAVVAINGDDGHTRPALVAPITLQNVPIGDLQLHGLDPNREFTEGELALISAVVDQVTQVAEGLRLLDETQEWASRERLIGQVSDKLHRAPDIDTLMQLAVDELARVLGPARTFVRLGSEAEFGVGPDTGLDNGGNGTDLPEDSLAEKIDDPSLRPTNGSSGESELNGNA